jgi:hypothetical protein
VKSKSGVAFTVLVPALLVAVLVVAGCGGGGNSATTTTTTAPEVTTTTAAAVEETTTTGTIFESTTTTSMPEETTTTGPEGTTTTTEVLSSAETRLANGHIKAMGFIDKVYVKDGKRYISIDYAEMLTGAEADAAAVAAGEIKPGEHVPDDFWIKNDNPQKRIFEVSDSVAVTTSTWTTFAWNEIMDHPVTWVQFMSFWSVKPPADALHLHGSPWWIERDGPLVVKIDEQFLP